MQLKQETYKEKKNLSPPNMNSLTKQKKKKMWQELKKVKYNVKHLDTI